MRSLRPRCARLLLALSLVAALVACEADGPAPTGPEGVTEPEFAETGDDAEPVAPGSACVTATFENQSHGDHPVLPPGAGATFSSNWRAFSIAHFQPSPVNLATWTSGSTAEVSFEPPASRVHFFYSTMPGAGTTQLETLDAGGNVVDNAALPETDFQVWEPVALVAGGGVITTLRFVGVAARVAIDDLSFCRDETVSVDVKPGNDDEIDPTNLNQKNVPLAVFTTSDFDATTADPASLLVSDPRFLAGAVATADPRQEDVDGDGDVDLLVSFDVSALADAGGIDGSTHQLLVSGATTSGQAIIGVDDVRVVGKR